MNKSEAPSVVAGFKGDFVVVAHHRRSKHCFLVSNFFWRSIGYPDRKHRHVRAILCREQLFGFLLEYPKRQQYLSRRRRLGMEQDDHSAKSNPIALKGNGCPSSQPYAERTDAGNSLTKRGPTRKVKAPTGQ